MALLVTGASGFVGRAFARDMAAGHEVVALSRKDPGNGVRWTRGDFALFEDLRRLDDTPIDAVVHLGAVTGGCSERDAVQVNVEGTRVLMRWAIDRGCRKFVLASSIAAVGMQSPAFRPLQVPIADEHPCLDRDGYGWSKFMMEEVGKYYSRQNAGIDVTCLRLSSVFADEKPPAKQKVCPPRQWGLGSLTMMSLSDAVRAFRLAAAAEVRPGARVLNAAGPTAWAQDPVADILRNWWGDEVDLSCFETAAGRFASVYDVGGIERALGFVASA